MDITDTGYQNVNFTDLANNGVQLYGFTFGNKSVGSTKGTEYDQMRFCQVLCSKEQINTRQTQQLASSHYRGVHQSLA